MVLVDHAGLLPPAAAVAFEDLFLHGGLVGPEAVVLDDLWLLVDLDEVLLRPAAGGPLVDGPGGRELLGGVLLEDPLAEGHVLQLLFE